MIINFDSMLDKLKRRWEIESTWRIIMILVVFTLTGSTAVYLKSLMFEAVGMTPETPGYIRWPFIIIATFLVYQVILLAYAFLLGQFAFFWKFEKKMLRRLRIIPKERA